jgi:hypothetical protein
MSARNAFWMLSQVMMSGLRPRMEIEEVVILATVRAPCGSSTSLCDMPNVQAEVARAKVLFRSDRSYLFSMISELWEELAMRAAASMRRRAMVRLRHPRRPSI